MKRGKAVAFAGVIAVLTLRSATQGDVTSGEFAYQGQLKQDGVPVTDVCDFQFSLWRSIAGVLPGDRVGPTLIFDGVGGRPGPIDVAGGLFDVALDFGPNAFNETPRFLELAVRCPSGVGAYSALAPREGITGVPYAVRTRGIAVDSEGKVGLGTETPWAPLHVSGPGHFRGNHLAFLESTGDASADGLAIQLSNAHTNKSNNFITFYNGGEVVTGRIEGFDLENGDWVAPPPFPDLNIVFDPGISLNPNWFDPGELPTASFTPGTLPTANFTPGTLPTAAFTPGTLPTATFSPGTLPSLSFSGGSLPTASLTPGTLPSLTFNGGSLPSLSFNGGTLPSLTFSRGTLPSLTLRTTEILGIDVITGITFNAGTLPSATFSTGTLPTANFSPGTLPTATFNRGTFPTLSFSPGTLPTATFNQGTLPSLTFNRGSLPSLSFSGGTLPTLNFTPGTLPALVFSGGRLPRLVGDPVIIGRFELSFDIPTQADLAALICWAHENGVSDMLTMNSVDFAIRELKEAVTQVCKDEGVTYGSKGADYAEWLPKLDPDEHFQFGQIVGVHGGRVSLKTAGAERIMAVSRAPVVVGNVPPESEKGSYVTVGFMGQLPVVVRGAVKAGDYVVPSGLEDGTAVGVAPDSLGIEHLGRTLGRAWSASDNDVYSLINVVIGLDGHEARAILRDQQERIENQARQQRALADENAELRAQLQGMRLQLTGLAESMQRIEQSVHSQAAIRDALTSATLSR